MESNCPKARVLAYYLPQFHPIPENDKWWGKGFTEWTNVGKSKPLFPGHYQPHVPADLGYYDLRVPETREAQAQIAREAGVEGFVYWHYWFGNGKQLLERPFKEVVASGSPDFPFALAWANQTWSGTLHGLQKGETLIEQQYGGVEDYTAHFNTVLPALKDKRYITCDGKPMFMVYSPYEMADVKDFIELWQSLALQNGLKGIYFVALCQNFDSDEDKQWFYNDMIGKGFDAINVINLQMPRSSIPLFRRIFLKSVRVLFRTPQLFYYDDRAFLPEICLNNDNVFPTLIPNWDHTPRSGKKGSVMLHSSPDNFGRTVRKTVELLKDKPYDKRFVFIKSWNEWGEGNHLEPDLKYGLGWLKELKEGLL